MTQDELIKALVLVGDADYKFVRHYLGVIGFVIPRDGLESRKWCHEQAKEGNAEAQYVLSLLESMGLFGPEDRVSALSWLNSAVAQDHLPALLRLAAFHESGWGGLQPNTQRALVFIRQAIERGYAPAMTALGVMYETGQNVPMDLAKARSLYERAARLGDAAAQYFLAHHMLESTDETAVAPAVQWLMKSAAQGHSSAHRKLGYLFFRGAPGIQTDKAKAEFHFKMADRLETA